MHHRTTALLAVAALARRAADRRAARATPRTAAKKTAESAKDHAGQAADSASARATARGAAGEPEGNDKAQADGMRSVRPSSRRPTTCPATPTSAGSTMATATGLDDDGKVPGHRRRRRGCASSSPPRGPTPRWSSGAC